MQRMNKINIHFFINTLRMIVFFFLIKVADVLLAFNCYMILTYIFFLTINHS